MTRDRVENLKEPIVSEQGLSNLMHEERHFDPPEGLASNANVTADVYEEADQDRVAFWGRQAERISCSSDAVPSFITEL